MPILYLSRVSNYKIICNFTSLAVHHTYNPVLYANKIYLISALLSFMVESALL